MLCDITASSDRSSVWSHRRRCSSPLMSAPPRESRLVCCFECRSACQGRVIDGDDLPLTASLRTMMICYYQFMHNTACADVVVCEAIWVAADKMTFIVVRLSASRLTPVLLLDYLNSIFCNILLSWTQIKRSLQDQNSGSVYINCCSVPWTQGKKGLLCITQV